MARCRTRIVEPRSGDERTAESCLQSSAFPRGALPTQVARVWVPPIKCQGIKTKLVPFILSAVRWHGQGRWVEPFLGSGVVAFNLRPARALLADTNPHIINFYKAVQSRTITAEDVRTYLQDEGEALRRRGEEQYYFIRERFNRTGNVLDFLFLNRSCFNGVMRFNRDGQFNVPFCRKPARFSASYITRVTNQVRYLGSLLSAGDWVFLAADWRETLGQVEKDDFIYADPPYEGRHAEYHSGWRAGDTAELLRRLLRSPAGFALSTWKRNAYRENVLFAQLPPGVVVKTYPHFYHVGSEVRLRNPVEEALLIKSGCEA